MIVGGLLTAQGEQSSHDHGKPAARILPGPDREMQAGPD